eukprot:scaffold56327_cov68-Phaeocystis_antarctica.AAC.18
MLLSASRQTRRPCGGSYGGSLPQEGNRGERWGVPACALSPTGLRGGGAAHDAGGGSTRGCSQGT